MNLDTPGDARLHLGGFLRAHRREILDLWERGVRERGMARTLSRKALRDHLPEMLDGIADMVDALQSHLPSDPPDDASRIHADERLAEGYGLEEVVHEYDVLGDAVLELLERDPVPRLTLAEVRVLNRAIDSAVGLSVQRFAQTRDRTLGAIDALTSKALTSTSLHGLLGETLRVLFDSVPAVDTAAVLLSDGDRLVVRAAAGMPEAYVGSVLRHGEGIAGRVAATRREHSSSNASDDPAVANALIRKRGLQALAAVPLLHGDGLVGVAQIGSTTAHGFSQADRVLFRAMAARLTSLIVQAQALEREQEARSEAEKTVAQLEGMLHASPVGIALLDRGLRYLRVNGVLAKLNGHTLEAHRGRKVRDMVPREDVETLEGLLTQVIRTGEPILGLERTLHDPRGRELLLRGSYFPVKDAQGAVFGVGGIVEDVTERTRVEQDRARLNAALEVEHARFDSLLRQLPVGVAVSEAPSGRVVITNTQADALLGGPIPPIEDVAGFAQLRGRHLDGRPYRAEEYPLVRALSGERVTGEVMIYDQPDGRERWINVQSAPVVAREGRRIGAVATFVDVTELMRVQRELRTSLEFQEQVMGILGHDLRTPLSVITTSAALLLRSGTLASREARLTGRVADNADRMARMISDLLDYTRARGPGIPLHRQPIALRHLARHAIEELGVAFPSRVIRLTTDDDTLGEWDPDRLAQVLNNLLGNALRYSPDDSPVDVTLKDDGPNVVLSVHNAGSPIPSEHLATLFEPFRRGPAAQRTPEGLGLGLFIVREIVSAHGGAVRVASTADEGTTFVVTLPRQPVARR